MSDHDDFAAAYEAERADERAKLAEATARAALTSVETAVARLRSTAIPYEYTPDAAGRIRKMETDLADIRRGLEAEASGPMEGTEYRIVTTRSATRTFNTGRILVDYANAEGSDLLLALWKLREEGALRITWLWSRLEKVFMQHDLELRKVGHELTPLEDGDLDAPHVGEVWTEKTTREAITR